ncbi:MAG: class I SAM-dependent methyltransferase [Desulfobulbaceae bacterium]|nr:MAG: class I SAM-dependent methyltransferase [Desulfobulbaceae bacterium]
MKICCFCGVRFETSGWQCPSCRKSPRLLEGFPAFAPSLAATNDGFEATHFAALAPLEAINFWFRSRNELIIWALGKYFPDVESFLEIGCGTGYVLSGLEHAYQDLRLSGSEIFSTGLDFAKSRVSRCGLFQMDARNIPFEAEFDVIGAFDVLEHIAEDERVLAEMYRAVRPRGGVIVTVPQHAFLWSQADDHARHVRRYSAADLIRKVQQAGFSVVRVTSFVSLLLPLMMFSRWRQRTPDKAYDPLAELKIGRITNWALGKILGLERALIRIGLALPAGGSLLLVARKSA